MSFSFSAHFVSMYMKINIVKIPCVHWVALYISYAALCSWLRCAYCAYSSVSPVTAFWQEKPLAPNELFQKSHQLVCCDFWWWWAIFLGFSLSCACLSSPLPWICCGTAGTLHSALQTITWTRLVQPLFAMSCLFIYSTEGDSLILLLILGP